MKNIFENNALYTAFPDAESHLKSATEKAFLVPIGMLSKNHFDPPIENDILIAIPIEAVDGLIGESTKAYHTDTCKENWLSYSLVGKHWQLDCDAHYFLGHNKEEDWVQELYNQSRQHYALAKDYFEQNKHLILLSSNDHQPPKQALIQLGGNAFALSNWYSYIEEMPHKIVEKMLQIDPNEPEELCETVVMLNEQQQEYIYLGCVYSYLYINPQTSWVHLFYDPQCQRMLMTFDYS